jgi:hypothetical protein
MEGRMKPFAAVTLSLIAIATCAAAPPKGPAGHPDRKCFWARNVNNFQAVDEEHVNIRVGAHDVYEMTMFGPCPDIDWAQRIALKSRGSSFICTALDAEIIAPSTFGPKRCAIRDIRYLTPAEVAALPKRARP